ncbi:hypothetical protein IAR55_005120 [Kwoniella newhampshirensis]|uniref:Integral membrane protein n=1 Tax=Kwoniella newhampshirensis TaxID=1651941 RepID=A0AAW0YNU3_9TREE
MGNTLSNALDPSRGRGVISIPDGYVTPSFPSLYIPTIHSTIEQRGVFLYEAEAIWHFTLYWTILLLGSLFLICSLLASFTLLLSITVFRPHPRSHSTDRKTSLNFLPLGADAVSSGGIPPSISAPTSSKTQSPLAKNSERRKRKRPPLWPIFLLPVVSVSVAAVIAVITGTVVGFALAAIYSAGGFSMSTWVPFLWALIQVLVLIISSYSTLTSIL